jgi:hypothetical protein
VPVAVLSKYKYNYSKSSILCVSKTVKDNFVMCFEKQAVVIHDCVSLDILNVKAEVNLREQYSISTDKVDGNVANHTDARFIHLLT